MKQEYIFIYLRIFAVTYAAIITKVQILANIF